MRILSILLFLGLFAWSQQAQAQLKTPAPSPSCKVEQMVGMATMTLDYSRPSMKGRELFVEVEKFGKIWRTGANASTKIGFDRDVMINGNKVEAGTYALYSIPSKTEWTIMLYSDLKLGGNVANYDESNEVLRFKVKPMMGSYSVETFMIMTDNVTHESADVMLMWGKYVVPFTVKLETDKEVMASIDKVLAGPSARDYYVAASYYRSTGKDMGKALSWIKMANEKDPKFWTVRMEAEMLQATGKTKEALNVAEKAMSMAKEAGYDGYAEEIKSMAATWK